MLFHNKTINCLRNNLYKVKSFISEDYTQLYISTDLHNWSLYEDAAFIANTASKLGMQNRIVRDALSFTNQSVLHTSQHVLLRNGLKSWKTCNIGLVLYHGIPGIGINEFDDVFRRLEIYDHYINAYVVSNLAMVETLLSLGICRNKIYKIHIGVNDQIFKCPKVGEKDNLRNIYQIPSDYIVVGSFQKDGNGWGQGKTPKYIKGPDILVNCLNLIKERVNNKIFVILTGPSRGYVISKLKENNIRYLHRKANNLYEVANLYKLLDLYLVTSRFEGGPKAILESMATGVPIITTPVGQAVDLVVNKKNGIISSGYEADEVAQGAKEVINNQDLANSIITNGKKTAASNTYASQLNQWRDVFSVLTN